MTAPVQICDATLYLGDCIEILPELGKVDAVVTDPPYGADIEYGQYQDTRENWEKLIDAFIPKARAASKFFVMPVGDRLALRRLYKMHNPEWMIAWIKGSPGTRSPIGFNSWEPHLVWGRPPVAMHDYFQTRCGFEIDGHPCPKPVAWATWLVNRAAERGGTILDPFMGSGTTGVACAKLGRRFIGIEIHEPYFQIACKRIEQAYAQPDMFIAPPAKPKQEALL